MPLADDAKTFEPIFIVIVLNTVNWKVNGYFPFSILLNEVIKPLINDELKP